ncbi:glutathione peroxidase, putative [Ixodes scapularis]|uniref:Glutathione peroxidase, putative n=1 Tax=Ixodes scapularis TaxID=6945 RepID=B7PZQ2_IXOSC|nr:glutathione peroxidase, putative [Ixodes scapularis]|eukprot:XP_002405868.1 glutathione peroxidase, putative [Ixodes scapularis]
MLRDATSPLRRQEPGTRQEILNGIKYVRPGNNYVPNFPMFQKIEVNGENQHPLYTFLKGRCTSPNPVFSPKDKLFYSPQNNNDIRWNFEKFLVDRRGVPVKRYEPRYSPDEVARDIEVLTRSS